MGADEKGIFFWNSGAQEWSSGRQEKREKPSGSVRGQEEEEVKETIRPRDPCTGDKAGNENKT